MLVGAFDLHQPFISPQGVVGDLLSLQTGEIFGRLHCHPSAPYRKIFGTYL